MPKVIIVMPDDWLAAIDEHRGDSNTSEFIRAALRDLLKRRGAKLSEPKKRGNPQIVEQNKARAKH